MQVCQFLAFKLEESFASGQKNALIAGQSRDQRMVQWYSFLIQNHHPSSLKG
jgi:hypothetical protein